jgi:hypothetical protein
MRYYDPAPYLKGEKERRYVEALKAVKRVIMTRAPKDSGGVRRREGYLGVFDIDNVEHKDGVQFTFVRRVA